jgi:hypothetical protein
MWFETAFLREHSVLTVRVQGEGESDLVPQMVTTIRSAPEFRPGMCVLIDALGTDYLPSSEEANTFAGFFKAQLPDSRLAVLVRSGAQYRISCLVEAIANKLDMSFAVFRNRDEALQWLIRSARNTT